MIMAAIAADVALAVSEATGAPIEVDILEIK
jgi:hypothetical protein